MLDLSKKIKLAYQLFAKPSKVWSPPAICDVLIYDATGLELISPYLKGYSYTVLHTRGESINSFILLFLVFRKRFWSGRVWTAYTEGFIRFCKPKLVITFIDNYEYFYSISESCSTVSMFIQNGIRSKKGDIFQFSGCLSKNRYRVDHMLVFGTDVGREYKNFLSGHVTVIGSFKNNYFIGTNFSKRGVVRFVSQWRPRFNNDGQFTLSTLSGEIYTNINESIFSSIKFILPLLQSWCRSRGKSLEIVGVSNDLFKQEKNFFDSILPVGSYTFVPAAPFPSAYKLIDSAEMVVSIDSTLGYESLARGKRVACFSCRVREVDCSSYGFGWPGTFPDSGPFWTNRMNPMDITRILDYVDSVSEQEWSEQLSHHFKGIMDFDPGNKRFSDLLSRIMSGRIESDRLKNLDT